ncbi:hypothetical protein PYW07_002803 [Mythimna separata]|uniref:Ubiquitin-like modifier-activating enzyme ATG7 n=1 Tax=Mythimna separata TaxID=271217 RepID=A0AAD8DQV4_MYTSE|nr:hypothetical protein PYW07_002803 [Mythimna separata]
MGAVFEVDGTSFNKEPEDDQLYTNVKGTLMNKNTMEEFKSIEKATFLSVVGKEIWARIQEKNIWINKPSSLLHFVIISFADLKKFNYYYWFGFPSPMQPTVYMKDKSLSIAAIFSPKQIAELAQIYKCLDREQKCFFAVTKENDTICVKTLSSILDLKKGPLNNIDLSSMYFVFNDPSNVDNPGWPLRMYLAVLTDHCPSLLEADIKVIGLRCNATGNIESSRYFLVTAAMEDVKNKPCTVSDFWVGWEKNGKGSFGPRVAKMSASLDPVILADTASDLNIKLMKWRLAPDINVDVMKSTKCLLLGAGTLGCHVARDLLAWGFRHITFIDNGKVSYSNPTRQVLYNFQDCLNGGRDKAEAAADSLRNILPTAVSKGITAHIPMPGHPIGASLKEETISNIQLITKAIADHDVIFLLLDTREARWLPTLIAAHYGKIVINAALGFDSYLVMRHGIGDFNPDETSVSSTWIPGGSLGCYFCNDVTAPGNSMKDRTLDQQCTVTRPGVAAIAGALAVEILVGLLQHPLRVNAPAVYNLNSDTEDIPPEFQGVLGPIPHTIRGFLHSYQTVTPTCAKFKQCIACSEVVINKYMQENIEFLLEVFNSGNYLEEVTGLHELHLAAEMTDILTFSDEDEE